jgi:hypothetical protein
VVVQQLHKPNAALLKLLKTPRQNFVELVGIELLSVVDATQLIDSQSGEKGGIAEPWGTFLGTAPIRGCAPSD